MSVSASVSGKEFLDIQATTECRFTLKRIRDMTRTYSLLVILAIFFTKVFNIDDVTSNDIIQRNQHRKEKEHEFHSNHQC